jgi:hypothetical protein
MNNTLKNRLQYHITGAIERGEAQAIVEIPPLHKGPFPLHITQNDDAFVVITNQGNHYAKTFDPSAARLIAAAPDLLNALKALMQRSTKDAEHYAPDGNEPIWAFISDASDAIAKADGR